MSSKLQQEMLTKKKNTNQDDTPNSSCKLQHNVAKKTIFFFFAFCVFTYVRNKVEALQCLFLLFLLLIYDMRDACVQKKRH